MTNETKLELLQNTNYDGTAFDLIIKTIDGTIMCNCAYDYTHGNYDADNAPLYPLDDIQVIEYRGLTIPVSDENMQYFKICEHCGEYLCIDDDEYIYIEDSRHYYHNHYTCTDDEIIYCDYHEEYEEYSCENFERVNTRNGEECWCRYAIEDNAFYSDYSDEYYSYDDYTEVEVFDTDGSSTTCTQNEADINYYWCENCQHYYVEDAYDHEADMCANCADTIGHVSIHNYHYSKNNGTLHFFGESKYVNPVGVGFELEVDTSYSNKCNNQNKLLKALKEKFGDRITFESDGSLDYGFEIISAPHTKSEMDLVNWGELMELCKEHGYRSHDTTTCGLHFHISGYMFGATKDKQYDTIAKVLAFYEYYFQDFIKLSRRDSGAVSRWADSYGVKCFAVDNVEKYKEECTRIVQQFGGNYRYYAMNLTNYDSRTKLYKTVEFRINRGTLNINTFNASWDLIVNMIKNAKKIDWNDTDFFNPKKWLKGCKANTYAYIVKRHAFEGVFHLINTTQETEYTQENA